MRLNPEVLTKAMENTECASSEEFGWKYLDRSGQTIRNYRSGKSVPGVRELAIFKRLTGYSFDDMIIDWQNAA